MAFTTILYLAWHQEEAGIFKIALAGLGHAKCDADIYQASESILIINRKYINGEEKYMHIHEGNVGK